MWCIFWKLFSPGKQHHELQMWEVAQYILSIIVDYESTILRLFGVYLSISCYFIFHSLTFRVKNCTFYATIHYLFSKYNYWLSPNEKRFTRSFFCNSKIFSQNYKMNFFLFVSLFVFCLLQCGSVHWGLLFCTKNLHHKT